MAETRKKYGVEGKKRFSVKYADSHIERYGTCDPREDERMDLRFDEGKAFLLKYPKDTYAGSPVSIVELPEGTLVANGFYDHEHDEWVTVEEFLKQK